MLDQLLKDVVPDGREFNALLVWDYSRLSRSLVRLAEVTRTLREHGVELVSVADRLRLAEWERQSAKLFGAPDDEAAG